LRFSVPLLLLFLLFSNAILAQDVRYVSGDQNVALRGGPGDDYQIIHRGIPPGSRLTVSRTSEDGLWADITTDAGDTGWIPAQKLLVELAESSEVPAQEQPDESSEDVSAELAGEDSPLAEIPLELADQIRIRDEEFNAVAQELYRLQRVSARAEQMDIDNRRLVDKTENLRSEVEMLQAENLRLLDKVESEDFMNGALAVLLGVIIALVAPRLVPKRRKSSSWA
jgi:SH3 domain protein